MSNNITIKKLFRVQGGIFPNRSRNTIRVIDNKIHCPNTSATYVGDIEHMIHFLFKRLGITKIEDIPENVKEYKVNIVEMYVPYWLTYLIEKYAVDQYESKDEIYPRLVDKRTPRAILSDI